MTVYVDNMKAGYGRMVMCHMIADTEAELIAMAERIGVQTKWIQHPDTWKVHFDIAQSKRALAIAAGAVEITMRQYAMMVNRRRDYGELGTVDQAREAYKARTGFYEGERE